MWACIWLQELGQYICCCSYQCCTQADVLVRKGHFISPVEKYLPPEAKKVFFRFYRPDSQCALPITHNAHRPRLITHSTHHS
jgi:hypothetical protein